MASFDTIASGVADHPGACDAPNLPEATLQAAADHAQFGTDTIQGSYEDAAAVLAALPRVGVDYEDAMSTLERGGVQKFVDSWNELLSDLRAALCAQRDRRAPMRSKQGSSPVLSRCPNIEGRTGV